ncbi:hypothetical protein OIO90_003929 [Microbotryomycetes sp. JL221]|nr:hypothetical protein OIO90_003929 [Microbotryomycetes sp. JL221]
MECFVCQRMIDGDEAFLTRHVNASQGATDQLVNDAALAQLLSTLPDSTVRHRSKVDLDLTGFEDDDTPSFDEDNFDDFTSPHKYKKPRLDQSQAASGSGINGFGTSQQLQGLNCRTCGNKWSQMDIVAINEKRNHVQMCQKQVQEMKKLGTSEYNARTSNFDWSIAGKDDKLKKSTGLIRVLERLLTKAHQEGRTKKAYLCSESVQHIGSKFLDMGWGCGQVDLSSCQRLSADMIIGSYRNIQMFLSDVRHLSQYTTLGSDSNTLPIPSILELQQVIEQAWSEGYDPPGSAHFKGKLVRSRRWIGTTEAYVALTWLGFRVKVIDFPKVAGSQGTNQALVKWIMRYFESDRSNTPQSQDAFSAMMATKGEPVLVTSKAPLYLQHQGHSRTVVGVDVTKNGDSWLLLYDPGLSVSMTMTKAARDLQEKRSRQRSTSVSPSSSPLPSQLPSTHSAFWAQQPTNESGFKTRLNGSKTTDQVDWSLWRKMLEPYRVSLKSLSRNDEYQLLCLDPGPALTASEKRSRRTISSTKITS